MQLRTNPLFFLVAGSLVLVSCSDNFMNNLHRPLNGGNALDPPGYNDQEPVQLVEATGPIYRPGQWVETSVQSAALYGRFPKSGDQPVRSLPLGTPLKVVSTEGTYAKVELESGAIGFVPTIMVAVKPSSNEVPIVPSGPIGILPSGLAPEPEIAPLSVGPAAGGPAFDRIDPAGDEIE